MLYAVVVLVAFITFGWNKILGMFKVNNGLTMVLLLVFLNGIIDSFRMPTFFVNLILEIIVLILFIYTNAISNKNNKLFRTPALGIYFLFSIVVLLSVYINNNGVYQSYLFYRFFLTPYLFMLVILNINLNEEGTSKLIKFVEYLYLFQLIATLIKLALLGRPEHPVGTLIVEGGGVATYVPLIASGFLLSKYFLLKRDKIYLILLIFFPLIAFASQKRGTFIFLPVIFLLFVIFIRQVDYKLKRFQNLVKYTGALLFLAFLILAFAAKTTKTMNPENSRFGSFDLNFLFKSSIEYNQLESDYTLGRFASFRQVNKVISSSDLGNRLFGYGPETLKGSTRSEGKFEKFGVAGTFPGYSYQLIQLGYLGAILWPLFYIVYAILIFRYLKLEMDRYWISMAIGTLIMLSIFMIDYFTYSVTFITVYALTFTISIAFGLLMKRYYLIRNTLKRPNELKNANKIL